MLIYFLKTQTPCGKISILQNTMHSHQLLMAYRESTFHIDTQASSLFLYHTHYLCKNEETKLPQQHKTPQMNPYHNLAGYLNQLDIGREYHEWRCCFYEDMF